MGKGVGIDLGTTYSVAAMIENGRAKVVKNAEGENLTPSVVAVTARGDLLVGSVAKRQAAANPERTVMSIKRHIGTDYRICLSGRDYSPQEISAHILQKIKKDVENYARERVNKAVITVPAYFNHSQRQATQEAAHMAGLEVLRIINEPTAASLAYGLNREKIQTILVWDLGGGTFDVSILELGMFHVKAVNGNTRLGGDDWDDRLVAYVADRFLNEYGVNPRSDPMALQRLKEACEKAKRELSYAESAEISLALNERRTGTRTLSTGIDRSEFENLTAELKNSLLGPTHQALADAGLMPDEIDRVVLVGGSTRMPSVRGLVEETFHKKPFIRINPDEVVGIGAAVQAGVLLNEIQDVVLVDVTPLSLGIETEGGIFARLIPRNAIIPTHFSQIFTNAVDDQSQMDFHILQGEREMAIDNMSLGNFQLTDIPPLPRGKAKVEVMFQLDVNGILSVSAQELYTEVRTGIRIDASHLLPEEEVQQAVREAEAHAEEDMQKREASEINIRADGLLRAADMFLDEKARSLPVLSRRRIEQGICDLKEALSEGDSPMIARQTEALRKILEKS
jgi:molecular chaperone DnaK